MRNRPRKGALQLRVITWRGLNIRNNAGPFRSPRNKRRASSKRNIKMGNELLELPHSSNEGGNEIFHGTVYKYLMQDLIGGSVWTSIELSICLTEECNSDFKNSFKEWRKLFNDFSLHLRTCNKLSFARTTGRSPLFIVLLNADFHFARLFY